jgi:hypothetical protein
MKKDTRITQCSKIIETSILNLFNVQDSMNMDQYAHQKAKEATGNYVGSGGVSVMTGIGVEGYQYPYYSLRYALGLQDNYDPLGLWNENSSRPKPELTGTSYAQDMVNDVADMYNGSQGNFNYLENYEAYNKSINK